jgi:hypothetical protein
VTTTNIVLETHLDHVCPMQGLVPPVSPPLAVPSPSPAVPSPSLLPPVQLALLSAFPAGYSGASASVSAASTSSSCVKQPAPQLGANATLQQPGDGLCGSDGLVAPGTYTLTAEAPPGTTFLRWELYNATDGRLLTSLPDAVATLQLDSAVTVVAVFSSPGSPSPSPTLSPR